MKKLSWKLFLSLSLVTIFIVWGVFARYDRPSEKVVQLHSPEPSPSPAIRTIKWGAYSGHELSDKLDFEERIGTVPDMAAVFVHWGNENEFPQEIANDAKNKNQTLVIYWESKDYNNSNKNDKRFSYDAILGGNFDEYIVSFGKSIKEADQEVILIPFEEVNGNWYPWSITVNNNSAEKHKLAYRKIHDLLVDIPKLKLGWIVNNGSAPDTKENSIANLYPGKDYVDFVGVDGFNFDDPWQTFSEVFDKPLSVLTTFDKPIMLFSMSSAEGSKKAAWIDDMGQQLIKRPEIYGFIWFNEDKERDWRIWSDPASLSAFQKMLKLTLTSKTIPDSQ